MREIVSQYNNAPHKGLSKWCGFDVTPNDVQNDSELEQYIVRQISKENHKIMNSFGYEIPIDTTVNVLNPTDKMLKRRVPNQPSEFKIIGKRGSLFVVQDIHNKNKIQYVPRWMITRT